MIAWCGGKFLWGNPWMWYSQKIWGAYMFWIVGELVGYSNFEWQRWRIYFICWWTSIAFESLERFGEYVFSCWWTWVTLECLIAACSSFDFRVSALWRVVFSLLSFSIFSCRLTICEFEVPESLTQVRLFERFRRRWLWRSCFWAQKIFPNQRATL